MYTIYKNNNNEYFKYSTNKIKILAFFMKYK